jgi:hypothetical protein
MKSKARPLYKVVAIDDGILMGVTVRPSKAGCGLVPTVCPIEQAARLHRTEAYKLRKWARSHQIEASTQLESQTPSDDVNFSKVEALLSRIL